MANGCFITFEGIDGCGKSTQIQYLTDHLKERGIDYLLLREPGGTVIGENIRNILLDKKNTGMTDMTELLLFEAARAQIVAEVIVPAVESGKVVICDRFFDSTAAYQGFAKNMGADVVDTLNRLATGGFEPDITFLLDISVEDALSRRVARGEEDRIEKLGVEFQKKVREGYLELAKTSQRIVKIDGSQSPEDTAEDIRKYVEELI
ncbi:MAG: dTMP kinase [Clostridiales bacterium]|nr:dTMP kinase [Clostridiales bacterium]